MLKLAQVHSPSNPFSTAFVRPGALPYLFPEGITAPSLMERLASNGWCGQIVGPHGSGKSTLLHCLLPLIREQRNVEWFTLASGQRRLPVARLRWNKNTLVAIDGYEQLSWWERTSLRIGCRRRGFGLLVTSHSAAGLPTIFTTRTSPRTTQRLAGILLEQSDRRLGDDQVQAAYDACRGNVRETFFLLYDLYQSRCSNRS